MRLNSRDQHDCCHVVRVLTTFVHHPGAHFCLGFELLNAGESIHARCLGGGGGGGLPSSVAAGMSPSLAPPVDPHALRQQQQRRMRVVQKVAHQLVVALNFLRNHDMIHADIKTDNLLLVDGMRALLLSFR